MSSKLFSTDVIAADSATPAATPEIAPIMRQGWRVRRRSTIRLGWSSSRARNGPILRARLKSSGASACIASAGVSENTRRRTTTPPAEADRIEVPNPIRNDDGSTLKIRKGNLK